MINFKRYPKEGATLLSANPCTVIATTENETSYFRARIIINYDHAYEESWGRIGNEVRVDLRNFYQNRFPAMAGPNVFLHGITRMTIFIVIARVELIEYDIETDAEIDRASTPLFYLMKSDRSKNFDDSLPFQLLDQPALSCDVSEKSRINFLTYYNQPVGTPLHFNLIGADGSRLMEKEFACTGPGQYLMQINCAWVNLPQRGYIQFGAGDEIFEQVTINRIDEHLHDHLLIYYKNDFGLHMTANVYGEQENSYSHEREEYARNDNSYTTYDVQSERLIKINTGHLYKEQLPIITAINQSREVFLLLPDGTRKARVASKKSKGAVSGQFVYDDTLEFILEDNLIANNDSKFENL